MTGALRSDVVDRAREGLLVMMSTAGAATSAGSDVRKDDVTQHLRRSLADLSGVDEARHNRPKPTCAIAQPLFRAIVEQHF
jgi:hypothetical protein